MTTHINHELAVFVVPPQIPLSVTLEQLLTVLLEFLAATPLLLKYATSEVGNILHVLLYWTVYWLVVTCASAWASPHHWQFWLLWLPWVMLQFFWFCVWLVRANLWTLRVFWCALGRHTALGWLLEVLAAWVFRLVWVPPPVTRAELVADPSVGFDRLTYARGRAYAAVNQVTHASVTSGGLTTSRLRRRAVWVCRLEGYLGTRPGVIGQLIRGRWLPDLPAAGRPLSANVLLALLDGEAKLLGGGALPCSDLDDSEVYLVVEHKGARRVLVPSLVSKLALYSCFRPRNEDLLVGLRARAREWLTEKGVSDLVSALVLPDAVEVAFSQTAPERLARERLDELGVLPPSS